MFTTHTDHVLSVDDAEFSWSSSSSGLTHSLTAPNEVSSCPSPASSLSSLPGSPSPSSLPSPLESESPSSAAAVRGARTNSGSTSTGRSRTRRVTRSRIPQVRICKLGVTAPQSNPGSSSSQETSIVPKPEGENGRPNRGGYTLSKVLGWNAKDYREAQNFTSKTVREILPSNVPFTSQDPEKLRIVREKMLKQFPALCRYENNWAADDFIRTAVKYRQSRVKLHNLKVQAAQGQVFADMQSANA